jgi:SAM-dependent methyltransferase
MQYDPIKQSLGRFFNRSSFLRRVFYRLLDILLLRTWHIHKALRQFFRQSKGRMDIRVLDAGSGFGQYTHYIARRQPGWFVRAVDLKTEEIEACRKFAHRIGQTNTLFEVRDLTELSDAGAFHLILSVDVMEHIEEDQLVFVNFFRSLKKGGMLLISTPSDRGGSGVKHESDDSFIEEHVRDGYGIEEITEKLVKAGFSRVEVRYTYGTPGSISWKLSMRIPITLAGYSRIFLILLPLYYLFVMPVVLALNLADLNMKHSSGTGLLVRAWKDE